MSKRPEEDGCHLSFCVFVRRVLKKHFFTLKNVSLINDAKNKVELFVNQQWKAANVITSQKKFEKVTVLFNDLNDWINIKKTISNMPIIDKFNVKNFSHNKAIIFLSFSGNLNQLKVAFKQSDLDFNLNSKKLNLTK